VLAGTKLAPVMPGPDHIPEALRVMGERLKGALLSQRSGMLLRIAEDTKASTLRSLVFWLLQVAVPTTYCTGLLPIAARDGLNSPEVLR